MAHIARHSTAWSRIALVATGVLVFTPTRAADGDASPFLGRWDLTLHAPDREYASWLDIGMRDSHLTVRMVGRWGHARVLPSAEIVNGRIRFVSPKEEEGRQTDMTFEGALSGQSLVGTTSGPDGTPWTWRATRPCSSLESLSAP